ncbi:MAG: VCBS repeat-containing protein, partial [Phycisphaerales bacterium]|nr:VCBS repeat-containing protein [Phycisphaerales bacterium]
NVPNDGDYTVDVASGDLNGDGKSDLLIANWSPNYIYWNDVQSAGAGTGDYKYTGAQESMGTAGQNENAMEAGDLDGDGDLDIYWSNKVGAGDRILRNDGNGGDDRADFTELPAATLPDSVTSVSSRKATMVDLNNDGRLDIVVMKEGGRPTILRNTTVGGEISFVDWTPRAAFPSNVFLVHKGWHAAAADITGDGRPDLVLGGHSNDHVFVNTPSPTYLEGDLVRHEIPNVANVGGVAVIGSATVGASDLYIVEGFTEGMFASILVNGPDDYTLVVQDENGTTIGSSNRGGLGVEEALQVSSDLNLRIRVIVTEEGAGGGSPAEDLDGDGIVGPGDLAQLLAAWGTSDPDADLNGDGSVGADDLAQLLAAWGATGGGPAEYTLEVLARTG